MEVQISVVQLSRNLVLQTYPKKILNTIENIHSDKTSNNDQALAGYEYESGVNPSSSLARESIIALLVTERIHREYQLKYVITSVAERRNICCTKHERLKLFKIRSPDLVKCHLTAVSKSAVRCCRRPINLSTAPLPMQYLYILRTPT
jgi:hypothetical protein